MFPRSALSVKINWRKACGDDRMDARTRVGVETKLGLSLKLFSPGNLFSVMNPRRYHYEHIHDVLGSAKTWSPGCVNDAGQARQKW